MTRPPRPLDVAAAALAAARRRGCTCPKPEVLTAEQAPGVHAATVKACSRVGHCWASSGSAVTIGRPS